MCVQISVILLESVFKFQYYFYEVQLITITMIFSSIKIITLINSNVLLIKIHYVVTIYINNK
jgi:hypothetical protein